APELLTDAHEVGEEQVRADDDALFLGVFGIDRQGGNDRVGDADVERGLRGPRRREEARVGLDPEYPAADTDELDEQRIEDAARECAAADSRRERRREDERLAELVGREVEVSFVVLSQDVDQAALPLRAAREGVVRLGRRAARILQYIKETRRDARA